MVCVMIFAGYRKKLTEFNDGVSMLTNATVADVLRPGEKKLAGFYDIALIIGGSLLIALSTRWQSAGLFLLPVRPLPC